MVALRLLEMILKINLSGNVFIEYKSGELLVSIQ